MLLISQRINKFSNDVFNALPRNGDNVLLSGLCLFANLKLASAGAKNQTACELRRALHCYDQCDSQNDETDWVSCIAELLKSWQNNRKEVVMNLANRVLITDMYNVVEKFCKDAKQYFDAEVKRADFAANGVAIMNESNSWVSEVTHGKINTILDYVGGDTLLLIMSAVYFRGSWKSAFDPKQTSLSTFYNFGKEATKVAMMYQEDVGCCCYSFKIGDEDLEAFELPYKGDVCLTIILPQRKTFFNDSINFDFEAFERKKLICCTADVMLPKFQFEANYTMNTALNHLGIRTPFATEADFSGISQSGSVYISRILHKAAIEVNEEGTEAAAASAVVCDGVSHSKKFYVEHPFMFLIIDKISGVVLFIGQVNCL